MDDDLRGLERASRAGDAVACAAWARALERLGRREEASQAHLAALDLGQAAAGARTALARLPAWAGAHGDAGRSGALDVEPLRRPPARCWHVPPAVAPAPGVRRFAEPYLLGGWLGLVALHPAPARVEVLDARDGRPLWSVDGWADRNTSRLLGDVVLLRGAAGTSARDVRTGRGPLAVAAFVGARQAAPAASA